MSSILFQSSIVLLLILLNGVFAMSELAIVSARKVRLEQRAERGDKGARVALALAQSPNDFLSAVQVGITLIGVLSGVFGGVTIGEELARRLADVPALASYAGPLGLGIVTAVISYLSLIAGELVPKRIALNNPERVASLVARPMRLVARVGAPLVSLLTGSTNFVLRVLGVRGSSEPTVTEEEIRALVEQGAETGVVQAAEQEMVESVFRLGDRQVGTIMTPRPDVDWIDITADAEAVRRAILERARAHLVVADGDLEHVIGVVRAGDLLGRVLAVGAVDAVRELRALASPSLMVPVTMPALRLLEELRASRQRVAVVLDEFGSVAGVVTMDDILEAIVGELPARGERSAPALVRRDDGSWLVDGATPVDELESRLDVDPIPADERRGFRTVAGFLLERLGHLPRVGEHVEWNGFRFAVAHMDGRRIDRVLIVPPATDEP